MPSPFEPWTEGPGVLELPDGRRLRGRGLRRPLPDGPEPEFGVYLTSKAPADVPWPSLWVRWPDFWLPKDRGRALIAFEDAYERCAAERVEIACGGGIGRTGTALACISILAGTPPGDAVAYVRARYHRRAVEMPWQRRFVRSFRA